MDKTVSIKVYEAYRLKKGVNLWDFVNETKQKAMDIAVEAIEKTITGILSNPHAEIRKKIETEAGVYDNNRSYGTMKKKAQRAMLRIYAHTHLGRLYKEGAKTGQKYLFDFDLIISIWMYKGRCYMIPYRSAPVFKLFGGKDPFGFLGQDGMTEPYEYWNNTDPPEGMPYAEWKRREKVWGAITDNWDARLTLEIITPDSFYKVPTFVNNLRKNIRQVVTKKE